MSGKSMVLSLRTRIAVVAAGAVGLAILLSSLGVYVASARTLQDQVDNSLRELAQQGLATVRGDGPRVPPRRPVAPFGGAEGVVQVIDRQGNVVRAVDGETMPVVEAQVAVASGDRLGPRFDTVEADGTRIRVLTVPFRAGAVQVGRPLDEIDASLAVLRRRLVLFGGLGVLLAAGLGLAVAGRAVRPVRRLTGSVEHVTATGDLSHRIEVTGDDEIARLGRTFNEMLASLEQARAAQAQLVADASHELRTPLTSLRTNIEVLAMGGELEPEDRQRLLDDVVLQLDEFGRLVGGLVELARGDRPVVDPAPVELDDLVGEAVARTRSYAPDVEFRLQTDPCVVMGARDRIDRAVANLLDNAVKYGAGSPVDVTVTADGRVVVRDHGPGIPDRERGKVFDRFYRSPDARGAAGSGLGLSIVKQVAEAHGGRAWVDEADGGGARFILELPVPERRSA